MWWPLDCGETSARDSVPYSVVIPAHNEEAVIGRCLTALLTDAPEGELEVLVVCNGCRDQTAQVARQKAPRCTVIEIPVASKVAALNAGDQMAAYFPRFYVDADVELTYPSLLAVAKALAEDGVLCAAPKPVFDLAGRSYPIRAFYDVFQGIPYLSDDMVGTGVYALSEEGRRRFAAFPELTADDQFIQQLFERSERRAVAAAHFVVHPPAKVRGILAMRARAYRGNRELARSGLARAAPPPSGLKSSLRRALAPTQAPAVAIYAGVNLLAKGLARRPNRSTVGTRRERPINCRASELCPGGLRWRRGSPCLLRHEPLPRGFPHFRDAGDQGTA